MAPTTRQASRANTPMRPLPAINPKVSHAYGSAGKATLASQVSTSNSAFDDAFGGTQPQEEGMGPPPTVSKRPTRRGKAARSDDDGTRPITGLVGSGYSLLGLPEQQQQRGSPARGSPPTPPAPSPPAPSSSLPSPAPPSPMSPSRHSASPTESQEYEPATWRIFVHTLYRYILATAPLVAVLLAWAFLMFMLATLFAWSPVPSAIAPYQSRLIKGMRSTFSHPAMPPTGASQEQMDGFDAITETLQNQIGLHDESIAELRRLLPDRLEVLRNEDGSLEIPEQFWQAMLEKMHSPDAAPTWDHFIDSNMRRLRAINDAHVQQNFDRIAASGLIISKETFMSEIAANNRKMEALLSEQQRNLRVQALQEAKKTAKETAQELIDKSPALQTASNQLADLAYLNVFRNTQQRMYEVNYLAIGLGALVDPRYTSDTSMASLTYRIPAPRTTRWQWMLSKFNDITHQVENRPNPPAAALLAWDEGTQCWCAKVANDERSRGQLGVQLPHKIYPHTLILEHIPPAGTRDIDTAPKAFEVWAEAESVEEAVRLRSILDERSPFYRERECGPPPVQEWDSDCNLWGCPTRRRNLKKWVCVFSGSYDIHHHNNVQPYTLATPAEAEAMSLITQRIVFRVTENWGGDDTCIYRVRLTGEEVSPLKGKDANDDRIDSSYGL